MREGVFQNSNELYLLNFHVNFLMHFKEEDLLKALEFSPSISF